MGQNDQQILTPQHLQSTAAVHWRKKTMDKHQRFTDGDRVRTIRATTTVTQNVVGTVQIVFFKADLYSVRFDGLPGFHIMHHIELEREQLAERTPNVNQA